jgi:hypothetical protein
VVGVVGVGVWWVWGPGVGVGGGFPLRSNIPRSALCATLDTYNFTFQLLATLVEFCKDFNFRILMARAAKNVN